MSCTSSDDALSWLLSISATCASSPIRLSSPADHGSSDFTDWLQMSPTSTPLQDVTSSARANPTQEPMDYRYDISDFYQSSQASLSSGPSYPITLPLPVLPGAFDNHNRMYSLQVESESSTLLNTLSPQPFSFYATVPSPSQPPILDPAHRQQDSPYSSPATKLFQDFQKSSFESYDDRVSFQPQLAAQHTFDISPVVRADDLRRSPVASVKPKPIQKKQPQKKAKRTRPQKSSSFVQKLRSVPFSLDNSLSIVAKPPAARAPTPIMHLPLLLSPVKLTSSSKVSAPNLELQTLVAPSPPRDDYYLPGNADPELSPLTPLESTPPSSPIVKLDFKLKRQRTDISTPPRRSKRPRTGTTSSVALSKDVEPSPKPKVQRQKRGRPPASSDAAPEASQPVFSNRTLPLTVPISPKFPLFYRRFPASSYYQRSENESPLALFHVTNPGGTYNAPRNIFDLYTPRFVKGKGVDKVGLCPICVEPLERGGENKKMWLAMKFSAFKCYHMQYAHGVSASAGKPFSPPVGFRVIQRPNPAKGEKSEIQQGQCHKCRKWVAVEGIKDMESKVPELYWWKHAATCHQDSSISGEADYFEEDAISTALRALPQ